jgi:hypothetical protein
MEVIRSLKERIERDLTVRAEVKNRRERRATEALERRERKKRRPKSRVRQLEDQEV